MPTPLKKPQLVNRGSFGLLNALPAEANKTKLVNSGQELWDKSPKNNIQEALRHCVVPISSLILDPMNARLHPEKNKDSIKDSLCHYGQAIPISVRKQNNVVIGGNGTLECMIELGWTEVAVTLLDYDDARAAGLSLALNRTAELAKWDSEAIARLDRLVQEAKHDPVGFTPDELFVLRAADWTPSLNGNGEPEKPKTKSITFEMSQYEVILKAVGKIRAEFEEPELDEASCIMEMSKLITEVRS